MGLKTAFIAAITAGTAVYGVQETKKQVFYDCSSEFGQVELVNPNRYTGHTDLHIAHTKPSGEVKRYDRIGGWAGAGPVIAAEETAQICRTGQPSANLRLRR